MLCTTLHCFKAYVIHSWFFAGYEFSSEYIKFVRRSRREKQKGFELFSAWTISQGDKQKEIQGPVINIKVKFLFVSLVHTFRSSGPVINVRNQDFWAPFSYLSRFFMIFKLTFARTKLPKLFCVYNSERLITLMYQEIYVQTWYLFLNDNQKDNLSPTLLLQ